LRPKTGRGDRDEHDGGLTSGGGRRQRPDFAGQPRRRGLDSRRRRGDAAGTAVHRLRRG
jgi:hypothetical protein